MPGHAPLYLHQPDEAGRRVRDFLESGSPQESEGGLEHVISSLVISFTFGWSNVAMDNSLINENSPSLSPSPSRVEFRTQGGWKTTAPPGEIPHRWFSHGKHPFPGDYLWVTVQSRLDRPTDDWLVNGYPLRSPGMSQYIPRPQALLNPIVPIRYQKSVYNLYNLYIYIYRP